jgi:hypothetical protein
MKKLCGVTAKEIREGYIFGVETDDEYGKFWHQGTWSECKKMMKRFSEEGTLSDFDSMTTHYQPDHLKPLAEFWFKKYMEGEQLTM